MRSVALIAILEFHTGIGGGEHEDNLTHERINPMKNIIIIFNTLRVCTSWHELMPEREESTVTTIRKHMRTMSFLSVYSKQIFR